MPLFNFNPIVKPKAKRSYKKTIAPSEKIIGVVWIDIEGNYYLVSDDGSKYNFTEDSYRTKDVEIVYVKRIDKHNRLVYARNKDYMPELNGKMFAPFGVGCIIECLKVGYEVKFLKVLNHYNEYKSKDALNYFRSNYKEIAKCLKKLK